MAARRRHVHSLHMANAFSLNQNGFKVEKTSGVAALISPKDTPSYIILCNNG